MTHSQVKTASLWNVKTHRHDFLSTSSSLFCSDVLKTIQTSTKPSNLQRTTTSFLRMSHLNNKRLLQCKDNTAEQRYKCFLFFSKSYSNRHLCDLNVARIQRKKKATIKKNNTRISLLMFYREIDSMPQFMLRSWTIQRKCAEIVKSGATFGYILQ